MQTGRLQVRQADMLSLPWQKEEFDLAYHQGVLEHFSDEQIVQALQEQARVARWVILDVPNHRHTHQPFGDERLLRPSHWSQLIREAHLEVVTELGRDFHRGIFFLPHAFFSRYALEKWPWFGRRFGVNSIFVCRSLWE